MDKMADGGLGVEMLRSQATVPHNEWNIIDRLGLYQGGKIG